MTMPKKKRGWRKITVDGIIYWWNPTYWEATEYVKIIGESGNGSEIFVNPLKIMTPKHIAAAIEFATSTGWTTKSKNDVWLGFDLDGDQIDIFEIPSNAHSIHNPETGRWDLPRSNQN